MGSEKTGLLKTCVPPCFGELFKKSKNSKCHLGLLGHDEDIFVEVRKSNIFNILLVAIIFLNI